MCLWAAPQYAADRLTAPIRRVGLDFHANIS